MENERIVFEIDISSYLRQLAEAAKRIEVLKQKQKELQELVKSGSAESSAALEQVNLKLKQQQEYLNHGRKEMDGYIKTQKKAVEVSNDWNKSVEKGNKAAKESGEATATNITVTNVSTTSVDKATEALNKNTEALENGKNKSKTWGEIFGGVGKKILSVIPGGKALTDNISLAGEAFETAGKGVKGFMASLGIGLLMQAIDILSTFKPVMDAIAVATDAVNASFKAMLGGGDLEKIVGAAANHRKVMQELADTQASYDRMVEQSNNTVAKYTELSQNATLTDEQRKEALKEVDAAEKRILDERASRLNKEQAAKHALFKANARLSDEEIKQLREGSTEQQEAVFKKLEASGAEQKAIEEYKALLLEKIKLDGDVVEQERNKVKLFTNLQNEINAKAEKAAEEERRRREKAIAAEQAYQDNLNKLKEEFVWDERRRLEESFKDKLESIRNNGTLEGEVRKKIEEEMAAALKSYDEALQKDKEAKQKEADEKAAANRRAAGRATLEVEADSLQKRIKLFELSFEEERKSLADHNISKEAIEEIHKQRLKSINDNFRIEELGKEARHRQTEAQLEMDAVDQSALNEYEKAEKKREILLRSMEEQLEIARTIAQADNDLTQEEKDNLRKLEAEIIRVQTEMKNRKKPLAESLGLDEKEMQAINTALQVAAEAVKAIGDVISTVYERRIDDINAAKDAEIAAIEESGLSEKAKQEKKKEAEKKAAMETYEIQLKQFKANKAISIVQTVIATAQAVMAQLSNPTPYVGIVLAALAAATGAVQIGLIASQKPPAPPKFAKGVIGLPGPGTETSDSIAAYLSKGESVITAKATKRFAPVLAQMEMAVGNVPNYNYTGGHFATGVIGDGGFYARESVNNVQSSNAMRDAIAQGFREAPQPVVSVQEITRVNNNVSRSVKVSEL